MPELRTWYRTPRALFHLSTLLDARQSSRECRMRIMRSCFFPDLLSIVQHSSLKPEMICFSRSTVLSLTPTLRFYKITVKMNETRGEGKRAYLEIGPRIDGGHGKGQETKDGEQNVPLPRLGHTTPNTHVTLSRDYHVLSTLGRL
jgi:hypothetical protein